MTMQGVLPGYEEMTTDLRQCVCECGCGMAFVQRRVGRVRKYLDKTHKAAAQTRRKNTAEKPLIGSVMREFMLFAEQAHGGIEGVEWWSRDIKTLMHALEGVDPEIVKDVLNSAQLEYCAH